jgi:TonB-linked SusC/RagA family outer membrane protein
MKTLRRLFAAAVAAAIVPVALLAQESATVTGRVTSAAGEPESAVAVRINALNVGATTGPDGTYRLVVPGARFQSGQSVQLTASRVGLAPQTRSVTLTHGADLVQNFQLERDALMLDAVVVTGAGLETRAVRLGTARASVDSAMIQRSNETNLITALAGRVPNVVTTQSSGEAGASTAIRIRGTSTIAGTGQPLVVVDGIPINNASRSTGVDGLADLGSALQGTVTANRASDLNPEDIESIEILKGPAATSVFGAQAGAAGAILITTKRGRAGRTTYSLRSSLQLDQVARTHPMQQTYGMGGNWTTPDCVPGGTTNCFVGSNFFAWGPPLPAGTPTFDNMANLYETGRIFDNTLTMSGGSDRTTFYLSAGAMRHNGYIVGSNDFYNRYTARLNASHRIVENLTVGGNATYVQTDGRFIQRGNSINGLILGAVRTPPEFDNRQYRDPTSGLHRSYRFPNPSPLAITSNRGFDNPFFAINEGQNSGTVGRVMGSTFTNWHPLPWLRLNYSLGADYSSDDRLEAMPQASSGAASGGVITRWQFFDRSIDHNLVATADYTLSPTLLGSVSLGQNLNDQYFRQVYVVGRGLIAERPYKLANTTTRDAPLDAESRDRSETYNLTGTLDVADQLFLTAGVTNFGSSRFGVNTQRAWYPRAQAAWTFTEPLSIPANLLSFGKARVAYGESGQLPNPYQLQDVFSNVPLVDFTPGSTLQPTLGGHGGYYSAPVRGNPDIKPERVAEVEAGLDLAFLNGRTDLSVTHYRQRATDVILPVSLAPSTGFVSQTRNAAEIENIGWEAVLNVRAFETRTLGLNLGANWARNRNELLSLGDPDMQVAGFWQAASFNGRTTNAVVGYPLGVFMGTDFQRCGRGIASIQAACDAANAPDGALYIGANGFPIASGNVEVIGDPNPDWTGGLNGELSISGVRVTAFLERRQGGTNQNMTRASMYQYGTHKDTETRAECRLVSGSQVCTGNEMVFGQGIMPGPVVGPGAGTPVPIGQNWYAGLGSIGGPAAQFQEDASFTRLREVSIAYTLGQPWVQRTLGFSSIDLRLSGRNLHTWTNYTGVDPEVNLGGAGVGNRGIDWMVNPLSRAWVFSLGLNH